ncbi:hypothetical protein H0H92_006504 [Tricholoma furcatifolium]|nr:hypothetical protein H0H92_006504 [Tricholoma furcatifolium]
MSSTSPSTSPKPPSPPPSTSPPRTPVDKHRASSGSPPSDDSSIIDDLSFDYVFDNEGNYVRLSKGSSSKSNHSSPPTPPENLPLQASDHHSKLSPPDGGKRTSLSRSESAYPVLMTTAPAAPKSDAQPSRSFQRVASASTLSSNKARPLPRRVAREESSKQPLTRTSRTTDLPHEKENLNTNDSEQSHEPQTARVVAPRLGYSRSAHLDGHHRQILPGPNRAGRVMMQTSLSSNSLRIPEYSIPENHSIPPVTQELEVQTEDDDEPAIPHDPSSTPFPGSDPLPEQEHAGNTEIIETSLPPLPALSTRQRSYGLVPGASARDSDLPPEAALTHSTGVRPRRSASLSDAWSSYDAGYSSQERQQQHQHVRDEYQNRRHGTTVNENSAGPRRVTLEEREREMRKQQWREDEVERRQAEKDHYYESHYDPPQPPIQPQSISSHRQHGHRRRDSDTLRSAPMSSALGSPTVVSQVAHGDGASPSGGSKLGRSSPPGARLDRVSVAGKVSPPSVRDRASPSSIKSGRASPAAQPRATGRISPAAGVALTGHRRSPTAPEALLENVHRQEREKEREARRVQQQQQLSERQQRSAPVPPLAANALKPNVVYIINKKSYIRLDMIGKGGSSRVYRVVDGNHMLYALKRVALDKTDTETMSGYMNEIALLKRLEGNSRIIRLIDSEVRPGPGGSKGNLMLVMECGEIDLASLISEAIREPLDMIRVAGFWKQMLQAVHVIHEEKIVHSDLKPANFVIVKGQLKLIDFGIANAIANDTTNIHRDHQIGTVNYMSPEAIEVPDGMRRLKVGRASDIWSLGCILYQMIYGCPPFQHLNVYQKMKAIPDASHIIDFPEYSIPLAPIKKSSGTPSGAATPPKRLDHLKVKVPSVVIGTIKSCLLRNPKERATIPELLEQNWLAMTDSALGPNEVVIKVAPGEQVLKVSPGENFAKTATGETFVKVAADETVINPYYMRQLLEYGIKLGQSKNTDMSQEQLLQDAELSYAVLSPCYDLMPRPHASSKYLKLHILFYVSSGGAAVSNFLRKTTPMNSKTASIASDIVVNGIESQKMYEIIEQLHISQGDSTIYRVRCKSGRLRNRFLALKKITLNPTSSPSAKTEFFEKTSLHQALYHPNIVSLLSAFSTNQETFAFHVLELCSVGDISTFLQSRARPFLSEPELRGATKSLAEALGYLQREGIVHGDINPHNILLTSEYGLIQLARNSQTSNMLCVCQERPVRRKPLILRQPTQLRECHSSWIASGVFRFAQEWRSSEIISGSPPNSSSDVWSLGCRQVASTLHLRIARSGTRLPDTISDDVQALLCRILEIVPENRIPIHDILSHPFLGSNLQVTSLRPETLGARGSSPVENYEQLSDPCNDRKILSDALTGSRPLRRASDHLPRVSRNTTRLVLADIGNIKFRAGAPDEAPTFKGQRRVVSDPARRTFPLSPIKQLESEDDDASFQLRPNATAPGPRLRMNSSFGPRLSATVSEKNTETSDLERTILCDDRDVGASESPTSTALPIGTERPTPFNTSAMTCQTHKTVYGQITILPSHSLLVDFRESQRRKGLKGDEVLLIEADGIKISVYSAPHLSSPTCLAEPVQQFSIQSLPRVYWKQYNDTARLVEQIKQRTPALVVYMAGAKCTLMANAPRGDIETLLSATKVDTPLLRLRLSRQKQFLEIARHVSGAQGEEWTKRTLLAAVETPYVSLEDWRNMAEDEKNALNYLALFVKTSNAVEGLLNKAPPSAVPVATAPQGADSRKDHRFERQQIPRNTKLANSLSFKFVPRPSKLSTSLSGLLTPDLTYNTYAAPSEDSHICRTQIEDRFQLHDKGTSMREENDITACGAGIQTRFIPSVGWCIRYASSVSQGDGHALDIDVDEDWVELRDQRGETTVYNIRESASNRKISERMKTFEEFVSLFDDSQEA